MTDEHALSRFNETAEKWRDLAEKRRQYFEDLHKTGRWKYYYTEALFFRRLGKAAELVELWGPVLKARLTEVPSVKESAPPNSAPSSAPVSLPSPRSEHASSPTLSMRLAALPRRRAV
jgi:hypothetical protein